MPDLAPLASLASQTGGLPPLPPGYALNNAAPAAGFDPVKPMLDAGVEITNGYRTPADIERLRAEGYTPATDSSHLNGDSVDLAPGKTGWSLDQLSSFAQQKFGPQAQVGIHNGTHVHVTLPGWGGAPGTPGTKYAGIPPLPPGASLLQRGSISSAQLTGEAHDGDTVRLDNGRNGRLFGADAYELNQQGQNAAGQPVPLGTEARDFILGRIGPGSPAYPVGGSSYGRPIITLSTNPFTDPARDMIRNGLAVAEPQYLQGSPQFAPYMDAERQARLNGLGGNATNAITPAQYRAGQGPWAASQPGTYGHGQAVFGDEPTPFQGYRPEVEKALVGLWQDPKATPQQYVDTGKQFGLTFDPALVAKKFASRFDASGRPKNGPLGSKLPDPIEQPRPLTNVGDGALGSFARGAADPVNMLDELGGIADTVAPVPDFDGPRENIWNSNRRFGDILWNNIDQNRSVLDYDQFAHPYARFGGQLASGLAIPGASVEGVGARAASDVLAGGGSEFAASQAARRAVTMRLGTVGGIEGGVAGFGAGEGGVGDRLPGAALGAAGGAALGTVAPPLIDAGLSLARRFPGFSRLARRGAADVAGDVSAPTDDVPPPPPGYTVTNAPAVPSTARGPLDPRQAELTRQLYQHLTGESLPEGYVPSMEEMLGASQTSLRERGNLKLGDVPPARDGIPSAAMAADRGPEIVGNVPENGIPPVPEGFTVQAPFGVTRPANERLSPEEMATLAQGVDPASVLPRPANEVASLDESIARSAGRFQQLEAPNEFDALPVHTVTTRTGGKVKIRGPLDVTQSLRLMGGISDEGGDLAHLGITNAPRRMDFGSNEQFLGNLINNDSGRSLQDAGHSLWEEGYFPQLREPPTPAEMLDVLHTESTGAQRFFHPQDLEDVANFHSAQAERGRIDAAEAAGSPLVEERGGDINLDDLIKNTPPASVYEDAPRMTGRVGNVNLDNIEHPEQISGLIDQISNRVGGFGAAARGRVTNDETQQLAQEMGVRPEQLLRRQQGQALNAEQLYASRALVQGSRQRVIGLAKKALGGSDEDVAAFRKAWLFHAALEEQLAGASAEAGRALQQFKMLAKGSDANGAAIRAYLRGGGGRDNIEDAARAIVDLSEDPAKANRFIAESVKPTWRDKFNELWVNSLLSGPRTHVVNFVGNAVTTAAMLPEQALTAGIGTLTRSTDRTTLGEVGARLRGMVNGSIEGLNALKSGAGQFVTSPGDWLANEHGPADMATKVENASFHALGGRVGQVVRLPTRALTAADEFWKSINRNAELHALAYREATKTSSDPKAWDSTYQQLLQAPTDDMQKQANEAARYYTFQKELGPTGKLIQQLSNTSTLGKILIPFVKTPTNLIKFAGERSAFAPAMPSVRAALKAGGRSRDEALARITLGSGLSTAAVLGAMQGRVSGGGPTDPGQRAALVQSGWQPYSFRIGNKWVSYSRLDPYSTLFGVAADLAEAGNWATKKELDQVALKLTESVAQNITNKTWLSGLSDAFDVLSDPQRYGGRYVQNLVASMAVPSLSNQAAQSVDPYMRDARSIVDAIKARVPVVSEGVPVRRNVWGDPIARGGAVGPTLISPFYTSTINSSPLSQEIARLQVPLTMPGRSMMVDGKAVPLTPQEFDELAQLSGKPAKQYLEQAIRSPEYRSMDDAGRAEFIKDSLADFRDSGREALKDRHPELAGQDGASSPATPPLPAGAKLPPLPPGFALAK